MSDWIGAMMIIREWHVRCPHCRRLTLSPTCIEKPKDVRCGLCRHEFTAAQYDAATKHGGWWSSDEASKK